MYVSADVNCSHVLGQHEAKMKSLSENIKEVDSKKRELEEQVDSLNEEVSKLKAAEQMHQVRKMRIS